MDDGQVAILAAKLADLPVAGTGRNIEDMLDSQVDM